MKALLSYARNTFWTVGIVIILTSLAALATGIARDRRHLVAKIIVTLIFAGFGVVICLGARAIRRQGRFARATVACASFFNLLIFPFGTVAGAVGLYWCFSRNMRRVEAAVELFEFESKKGDGTHGWMQKVVPILTVVTILGSLRIVEWWGEKHGLPRDGKVHWLILIFLGEWISVLLHELGHVVAGYTVNMRPVAFNVGPLTSQKRSGRWKVEFIPAGLLNFGGSAATVPVDLQNLRRRMAVEIAGGPVASLLTAALATGALLLMPGSGWAVWWQIPAIVAAMSICGFLINLLPIASAAGYSDGALLVQLLLGGPYADMREAGKIIGVTTATSMRPRDVDTAVMARAVAASTGKPEALHLRTLQLICAVDRDDLDLARTCLESVLEVAPTPEKTARAEAAAEIGFYIAYLDGHSDRAEKWLQDTETFAGKKLSQLTSKLDYWKCVAAVRMTEGREIEAADAWRRAKNLADRAPATGLYDSERALLEKVNQRTWLQMTPATVEL